MPLGGFVAGGDHGQHIGQWSDLRTFIIEGRCFYPGVFAVILEVGVLGNGFAIIRMQRALAALVPGMFNAFFYAAFEIGILVAVDLFKAGKIAVVYITTRKFELRTHGVDG